MISAFPLPFREAVDSRQARSMLPTDFRTRLLDEIPAQLRERSFFSAGVTNAEFLDDASSKIDELLSGQVDRATKRLELNKLLFRLQYQPVQGEEGTLTDLSSDARLNLILDTNLQLAQGAGRHLQGQDAEILDQWPAQELYDTNPGKTEGRRDWSKRWSDAINELGSRTTAIFYNGRLVALKNLPGTNTSDPIWTEISRFGLPYGPFDFGSYWDVRDVTRKEAMSMKLIDRDTRLQPDNRGFNDDLQASPEIRSNALEKALLEHFNGSAKITRDGVLRWIGGA